MKKNYLLVILLCFGAIQAQIVNFTDADFKAKLLQAGPNQMIASTITPDSSGNVTIYTKVDTNGDGEIQVSEAALIKYLNISSNLSITSLEGISSFVNLQSLQSSTLRLTDLDLSALTNLKYLYCSSDTITSLNVNGLTNLQKLSCPFNELTTLNLSGLISLKELVCVNNNLTALDLTGLVNLTSIECSGNQLTSLNVTEQTHLSGLYCYNNLLTELNLANLSSLTNLNCRNNHLTSLDVNSFANLRSLTCDENQLGTLFVKNNNTSWTSLSFSNNPTLVYICADEADIASIQQNMTNLGYTNCQVNSYCNFNPGGIYYSISGTKKVDGDTNGCDASDTAYPYLKFNLTSGTTTGTLITNATENYTITVPSGTHTITPNLENASYFTVSPASATVSFPATTSPFVQNFCIAPNGVHHDLEIALIPLRTDARPGVNVPYKIKYKNKGNLIENATVSLVYEDAILDYVAATPTPTSSTNSFTWNVGTLAPFQTGEITITLNINTPLDTPPVNLGDILHYTATIIGLNSDDTPQDNIARLNQTVINSFDPNDKTCLEGTALSENLIGKYVHYRIRFENTGNASAENIVVKDIIDTTKFDIASLQLTDASHSCVTRIDQNKVEFIFENINLPFADETNDGYVVFKIKTKASLTVGSTISNSANIYFDYNFPIVTNTATSTFETLKNDTFDFDAYWAIAPNPVGELLHLKTKLSAEIYRFTIYNLLGQQVQTALNPQTTIDVSSLKPGNYLVKVISNKGISSSKFVKQ